MEHRHPKIEAVACNDNNPCTDNGCNAGTGQCVYTNDNTNPCSDGNLCTTGDTCSGGSCVTTPVVCNDGNVCTTDSCNPGTGSCGFANNTNACNDGNPDTNSDTCAGGVCVGVPAQPCGTLLNENFEAYASGTNPANWFDTGANNSMSPVDNFQVFTVSGQKVFRTLSVSSDIHSHYVTLSRYGYFYLARLPIREQLP